MRLVVVAVLAVVVLAVPARARAEGDAVPWLRLGVTGAAFIHMEPPDAASYHGLRGGVLVGWRTTPWLALQLRTSYQQGSHGLEFETYSLAHHELLAIPSLRLESAHPWIEVGLGLGTDWWRYDDGSGGGRHQYRVLLIAAGTALASRAQAARPHVEAGLEIGDRSFNLWVGFSLVWH